MCYQNVMHHALPNKSFQLESSSFTLDGHRDSVNAVKFDADLSMLLSGGKLFVGLPSSPFYNRF
jgi:hypothetical protein